MPDLLTMLYELPSGERLETDDVTAIIIYSAWNAGDVHINHRAKGLTVLRFDREADALVCGQTLRGYCSADVEFHRRSMLNPTPRFRDHPSNEPSYSLYDLKQRGLRPRTGEAPVVEYFQCYSTDRAGTWHFGPERITGRAWRLGQTVLITPRDCSPALASAIKRYNAAPTEANKTLLLTLQVLEN